MDWEYFRIFPAVCHIIHGNIEVWAIPRPKARRKCGIIFSSMKFVFEKVGVEDSLSTRAPDRVSTVSGFQY